MQQMIRERATAGERRPRDRRDRRGVRRPVGRFRRDRRGAPLLLRRPRDRGADRPHLSGPTGSRPSRRDQRRATGAPHDARTGSLARPCPSRSTSSNCGCSTARTCTSRGRRSSSRSRCLGGCARPSPGSSASPIEIGLPGRPTARCAGQRAATPVRRSRRRARHEIARPGVVGPARRAGRTGPARRPDRGGVPVAATRGGRGARPSGRRRDGRCARLPTLVRAPRRRRRRRASPGRPGTRPGRDRPDDAGHRGDRHERQDHDRAPARPPRAVGGSQRRVLLDRRGLPRRRTGRGRRLLRVRRRADGARAAGHRRRRSWRRRGVASCCAASARRTTTSRSSRTSRPTTSGCTASTRSTSSPR